MRRALSSSSAARRSSPSARASFAGRASSPRRSRVAASRPSARRAASAPRTQRRARASGVWRKKIFSSVLRSDFSQTGFSFSETRLGCLRQIVYGIFLRAWSESGPAPDNKPAPRPSPSRKSNIGQSDSPPDARKRGASGRRHPAKKILDPGTGSELYNPH